nr:alpha/beta family hydrolase [Lacimicrobium sp. SS2-24]
MLLTNKAEQPVASLLLAHGAGAGMNSDFMQQLAEQIAACGVTVHRFNFSYMQRSEEEGKKRPPQPLPKLMNDFEAALESVDSQSPLFVGGKSMGGRVASMLGDSERIKGCLCYGYPFHPPGKPDKLRTAHLQEGGKPILILQGERDPFGTRVECENFQLHPRVRLSFIDDGEHSFKPRKSAATTLEQNMTNAAHRSLDFIKACL